MVDANSHPRLKVLLSLVFPEEEELAEGARELPGVCTLRQEGHQAGTAGRVGQRPATSTCLPQPGPCAVSTLWPHLQRDGRRAPHPQVQRPQDQTGAHAPLGVAWVADFTHKGRETIAWELVS